MLPTKWAGLRSLNMRWCSQSRFWSRCFPLRPVHQTQIQGKSHPVPCFSDQCLCIASLLRSLPATMSRCTIPGAPLGYPRRILEDYLRRLVRVKSSILQPGRAAFLHMETQSSGISWSSKLSLLPSRWSDPSGEASLSSCDRLVV